MDKKNYIKCPHCKTVRVFEEREWNVGIPPFFVQCNNTLCQAELMVEVVSKDKIQLYSQRN